MSPSIDETTRCKRIVSRSASGDTHVIEGNRKVWVCEDGTKLQECEPQYRGPVWNVSGDHACPGYKGGGGLL